MPTFQNPKLTEVPLSEYRNRTDELLYEVIYAVQNLDIGGGTDYSGDIAANTTLINSNTTLINNINSQGYLRVSGNQFVKGNSGTSTGLYYNETYDNLYQESGTDVYRYGRYISQKGRWNVYMGHNVLAKSSAPSGMDSGGDYNVMIGRAVGRDFTGIPQYNVLLGGNTAMAATRLSRAVAIGTDTARGSIVDSVCIGTAAGYSVSTDYGIHQSVLIGEAVGTTLTSTSKTVIIGSDGLKKGNGGTGLLGTPRQGVYLGFDVRGTPNGVNEIVIGAYAKGGGSNTTTIGTQSTTKATLHGSTISFPNVSPVGDTASTITNTIPITLNGVVYKIMLTT